MHCAIQDLRTVLVQVYGNFAHSKTIFCGARSQARRQEPYLDLHASIVQLAHHCVNAHIPQSDAESVGAGASDVGVVLDACVNRWEASGAGERNW